MLCAGIPGILIRVVWVRKSYGRVSGKERNKDLSEFWQKNKLKFAVKNFSVKKSPSFYMGQPNAVKMQENFFLAQVWQEN